MGPIYLNPDRINYVMDVMNQFAVNGVVDGNNPDYKAAMAKAEELFPTPQMNYIQVPKTEKNQSGYAVEYTFTQDQLDAYQENTGGAPKVTNYNKFMNEENRDDDSIPDYIPLSEVGVVNVIPSTSAAPATPAPSTPAPSTPAAPQPVAADLGPQGSPQPPPEPKVVYMKSDHGNSLGAPIGSSWISMKDRNTGIGYTLDKNEGKSGDMGWHGAEPPAGADLQITQWIDTRGDESTTHDVSDQNLTWGGEIDPATSAAYQAQAAHEPGYEKKAKQQQQNETLAKMGFFDSKPLLDDFFGLESYVHPLSEVDYSGDEVVYGDTTTTTTPATTTTTTPTTTTTTTPNTDDMSFNEAFDYFKTNNPGQNFTWRNNEYTTDLAPSTPQYNMFGDVVTPGVNDDVTLANQSIAAQNIIAAQDDETFDAMGDLDVPVAPDPVTTPNVILPEVTTQTIDTAAIPDSTPVVDQTTVPPELGPYQEPDLSPSDQDLLETFDDVVPNAEGVGYDVGDSWTVTNSDGGFTNYEKKIGPQGYPIVEMVGGMSGGGVGMGPQMSGGVSDMGPGPMQGPQQPPEPTIEDQPNVVNVGETTTLTPYQFPLGTMKGKGVTPLYGTGNNQLWNPAVDGDDYSKLKNYVNEETQRWEDPFEDFNYQTVQPELTGSYTDTDLPYAIIPWDEDQTTGPLMPKMDTYLNIDPDNVSNALQHYADLAYSLRHTDNNVRPKGLEDITTEDFWNIKNSIQSKLDMYVEMADSLGLLTRPDGTSISKSNISNTPANVNLVDFGQKDILDTIDANHFENKRIDLYGGVGEGITTTGDTAFQVAGDPNLMTPTLASINQLDDSVGEGITTGGTGVGASVTPEEALNFGKDDETFDAMGATMNMFGDMGIQGESDDTTLMAQESAAAGATGQIVPGYDFNIDQSFWPEGMSLGKALYNNIFGEGAVDTYGEYVGQTINDMGASAAAGFLEGPLAKGLQGSAMYMDRVKNWLTGADQMETSTFESGAAPIVSWLEEAAANVYDEMSPQMQDRVTGNANFAPDTTWGEIFSGTAKMQGGGNMFDDKTALAVKGMEDFYDVVLDVVAGVGLGKKGLALVMGTSAAEGFASADEQAQQSITEAINDGTLNLQEIADSQFNGDIEAAENEARNSARFIAGVMSGPVAGIGDTLVSATLGLTKPITGLVTDTLGKTTIGKVINPLLNIGTKTATAGLTGGAVEATEQVTTNLAEQQAGLDTPLGEGAAAAFGQGVIGQGVPGAAVSTGTEVQALGTDTTKTPEGIQTVNVTDDTTLTGGGVGATAGGVGATLAGPAGITPDVINETYETASGTANIPMNTLDDATAFEDDTVTQTVPVNTGFVPTGPTVGQTAQTPETVVTSYDTQPDTTTFATGTAATGGNTVEELMAAEDVIKNEVAETGELSIETATKLSNQLNMPMVDIANMAEQAMGLTPSIATGEGVTTGTGMVPTGGPGTFEVDTNVATDTTPANVPLNVDVISSEEFQKLQDAATGENLDQTIADQIAKVEGIASDYGIDTVDPTLTPDMDTAVLQPEQQFNMFGDTVDDYQGVDDNVLAQQEQLAQSQQETVDPLLTPSMEQAVFEDPEGNQLPAGVLDFTDDGITQSQLEDVKDTLDDETLDAMADEDIDETLDAIGGQVEVKEGDTFQDVLDKLDEINAKLDPKEDAVVVDVEEETEGDVIELPDLTDVEIEPADETDDETLDAMAEDVEIEPADETDDETLDAMAEDVVIEAADETDDETLDALGGVDVEVTDETDDETLDALGDETTEVEVPAVEDETDDETLDAMAEDTTKKSIEQINAEGGSPLDYFKPADTEVEVEVTDETDDETLDAMGDETDDETFAIMISSDAMGDETDDETFDAMGEDTTEVKEEDDSSAEVVLPAQTTTETLTGIGTEGTTGIGSTVGTTTTGTQEVEDEIETDLPETEAPDSTAILEPEQTIYEDGSAEVEVKDETEEKDQKKTVIPPVNIDTDQTTEEDTEVELDEEVDQAVEEDIDQTIEEETDQTVDEEIEEDIDQTIDEETDQTIDEEIEEPILTTESDADTEVEVDPEVTTDPVVTVDVPEEEEEEEIDEEGEVEVEVAEDEEIPATAVSADSDSEETAEDEVEFECPDGYIKVQQADGSATCVKENFKMSGRRKIATSPYISKKGFAGPSPYSNRTRKTSTKTYTDPIKV